MDSRFHGNDGPGENQGRSVTPMTIGVHNKKPVWKPPVCQQRCFFIEGIFYRRRISIEGIFYSGFPFSREWRSWWKPGAIRHSDDNRSPRQKSLFENTPRKSQRGCFFIGGISIEFFFSIKSIEGIFYSGFPFSREWRSWWKPGAIRHSDDNRSPQQKACLKTPRLSTKVFFYRRNFL